MRRVLFFIALLSAFSMTSAFAGPLDGTFLYIGGRGGYVDPHVRTRDLTKKTLSFLKTQVGIKHVIIPWIMVKKNLNSSDQQDCSTHLGFGHYEPVGGSEERMLEIVANIMNEATALGMGVVIGLTENIVECYSFHSNSGIRDFSAGWNQWLADKLEARFGNYFYFWGFYLPDESVLAGSEYVGYTKAQVGAIRQKSSRAVFHSPYLGNADRLGIRPSTVGRMAQDFLQRTGVNHLLYQDSAGGGFNLGTQTGLPTLENFYQAIFSRVHERLQAINELFDNNYAPASMIRINAQMWQSRPGVTAARNAWIVQEMMSDVAGVDGNAPEAKRLLTEFRATSGLGGQILPFRYSYPGNQPSSYYPDTYQQELNNGILGHYSRFQDREYVGVLGDAVLQLDLGSSKRVDFISVHVLEVWDAAIVKPARMEVFFSSDGVNWQSAGTTLVDLKRIYNHLWLRRQGDYVISNHIPLARTARYFRVKLPNNAWNFLSEIVVSASR